MKFYEVSSSIFSDTDNGVMYFATLKEAMAEARDTVNYQLETTGTHDVTVERVEIPNTTKTYIVALANHRGWCSSREKIWPK